jgi:hypothetical protein
MGNTYKLPTKFSPLKQSTAKHPDAAKANAANLPVSFSGRSEYNMRFILLKQTWPHFITNRTLAAKCP